MLNQRQSLGKLGEAKAQNLLQNKGYLTVELNFHTNIGEIDLIMLSPDHKEIVFVEVKTRTNPDSGHPEESISKQKLKKIQRSGEIYLIKNPQYQKYSPRIDVVAIEDNQLSHYEAVY